jgi:hypothetical protein
MAKCRGRKFVGGMYLTTFLIDLAKSGQSSTEC